VGEEKRTHIQASAQEAVNKQLAEIKSKAEAKVKAKMYGEPVDPYIPLTVSDGKAGFAADENLTVTMVKGAAKKAGVMVGMKVIEFQGNPLPANTTWEDLKVMVTSIAKPWTFLFERDE